MMTDYNFKFTEQYPPKEISNFKVNNLNFEIYECILSTMMNEKLKVNSKIIYFNKNGNDYDATG